MAFIKTGIAFNKPRAVTDISTLHTAFSPQIGEEKDGNVWDGEKWVPKAEWEKRPPPKGG